MAKKVVRTSATGEETVFDSLSKAAVETASVSKSTLIRYLKAGLGSALGGYTWKFVAEPAAEPAAAGPEPVEPIVEPIELEEPVVPSSETVHEPAATDADIEHVRSFFEALRTDDGRLITEMRVSDGYVNATKMCQSAKKDCGNYLRNQGTIIFIDEFSRSTGIPGDLLVQTTMTGPNENRGTWVHPDVAIDLARHCSPAFHVKVIEIVRRYASGQITTSESQAAARMAAASMKDAEFDNRKRKMELDQREWEIEKKRREEGLELAKTQQAMEEKRLELSKAQRQMELADPKHVVESYFSLCEKYGLPLESTDRLIAKDYIKNAIFKPGGPSESRVLLPISDVYRNVTGKTGNRTVWIALGRYAAPLYRKIYGKDPEKAERFIDGSTRQIAVYEGKDDEWLGPLIKAYDSGRLFGVKYDSLSFQNGNIAVQH